MIEYRSTVSRMSLPAVVLTVFLLRVHCQVQDNRVEVCCDHQPDLYNIQHIPNVTDNHFVVHVQWKTPTCPEAGMISSFAIEYECDEHINNTLIRVPRSAAGSDLEYHGATICLSKQQLGNESEVRCIFTIRGIVEGDGCSHKAPVSKATIIDVNPLSNLLPNKGM